MGFTVYAPRQDGNARFSSLQLQLAESSSITRVVVADGNGKLFYSTIGGGGGTGTVTNVSVVSANGLAGTVVDPTTTPAITLSTTVTGILKGNGTAISAATPGVDYITSTQGTASWAQNAVSSSYAVTASYVIGQSLTASYALTASLALNFFTASVTSASIATTASYALTASSATDFIVSGSITASNALVTGTITAQTLLVQVITSSIEYSSGSNIFGSKLTDTQQFTGSVSITGSLSVEGQISGSGFTGSLYGTSSWALNFITSSVTSASYAATASYLDPNFLLPKVFQIVTGSISASVNVIPANLFLINSGSNSYFNISSSGNTDIYSNLFIIRNFTTKQPVLTVSQSIIQIATQSFDPAGNTNAGTIWFTSASFYVGLE